MKKKLMSLVVASLLTAASGMSHADGGAYIGYKQQDFKDTELQILFVEYEHSFNKYFSVSAQVGTGLNDDVSQTKTDTYVSELSSTDILVDTYEESASVQHEYGISLNGYIPITEAFYAYGRVGYMMMEVESTSYPGFNIDTPPSEDPQSAFDGGASLCESTGIESRCGVSLDKQVVSEDADMGIGEIGVKWEVTNEASFMIGYSKSLSGDDSYDGVSLRVGVVFW
jgi:hypothetical protein